MNWSFFAVATRPKLAILGLLWTLVMMTVELLITLNSNHWLMICQWLWILMGVMLVVAVIFEYMHLLTAHDIISQVIITRSLPNNLPVNEQSSVYLSFYGANTQSKRINKTICTIKDHLPANTREDSLDIRFLMSDMTSHQGEMVLEYRLYTHTRGHGSFGGVDWQLTTPLGLLTKHHHTHDSDILGHKDVRVLANFKAVLQGHLALTNKHRTNAGTIKKRQRGHGQNFHQIRAYTDGDGIRHIDWKSTARHQQLMTKEYIDETDQEILFLIDCGQHMRHSRFDDDTTLNHQHHSHISHLDMALNAMLLLAQIACKQSDAVGFMSFGAVHDKIALPKKGSGVISYLLNQSFDLMDSNQAPDYMAIAKKTLITQKRRSLIIMITNITTQHHDELINAVQLLSHKHRVIVANLLEQDLQNRLADSPQNLQESLTYHGIYAHMHTQKQQNAELCAKTSAMVVGCTPQDLPQRLINAYQRIKQQGMA